jgi:hypothetical protein
VVQGVTACRQSIYERGRKALQTLLLSGILAVEAVLVERILLVRRSFALLESKVGVALFALERHRIDNLRVEGEGAGGDEGSQEDDTTSDGELDSSDLSQRSRNRAFICPVLIDDFAEEGGKDGVEDLGKQDS